MGGGASKPRKKSQVDPAALTPDSDAGSGYGGKSHGYCYQCGSALTPGARFCHDCGTARPPMAKDAPNGAGNGTSHVANGHRHDSHSHSDAGGGDDGGHGERMVLSDDDADAAEPEVYDVSDEGVEASAGHRTTEASPSPRSGNRRKGAKQERPKTASGAALKFLGRSDFADKLTAYFKYIFGKADVDCDGVLNLEEFTALVQSQTLDLQITDNDAKAMFIDYDQSGNRAIGFDDFAYVMTDLMKLHSARLREEGHEAWEWFVLYFDDDPNSLPLYLNTEHQILTYDKPAGIEFRLEANDEQQFENMVHTASGAVYTTLVDETGQRLFLDTETGQWHPFPDEWYGEFELEASMWPADGDVEFEIDVDNADATTPTAGGATMHERFTHPMTGVEFECMVENGVRMYFGASSGQWVPMPLMLELCVPSVVKALDELGQTFPGWTSEREKIMALRAHKYDVEATAMWKYKEDMYDDAGGGADPRELLKQIREREGTVKAAEMETMRDELNEVIRGLERRASELEQEVERATSEAATMAKLREQVQEDATKLRAELAERERESAALQAAKAEAEAAVAALKSSEQAQAEATAVRESQLETRVKELTEQLEATAGKGGSLEKTLKDREAALEAARSKVSELSEQVATSAAAQRVAEQRADAAEAELAAKAAQSETMSTKVHDFQATKQQQAVLVAAMSAQLARLRGDHKSLRELVAGDFVPTTLDAMRAARTRLADKCSSAVADATKDLITRYRYEVRQRKLLYNQLQELRGNIRVFCRVRRDDRVTCALEFPDRHGLGTPTEVVCPNPRDPKEKKKFAFDVVFNPDNSQADVFDDTEPVMTSCVDGYNVCIIAYGQTGSGKTHTMMGTEENPGVNRRAVRELLRICAERDTVDYNIKVSLLEIYNEKFVDLLTDVPVLEQQCDLRMDPQTKQAYVTNLTERPVRTIEDVVVTLADGEKNRSVASTKMNSVSSRSHLLLQLAIEGKDKIGGQVTKGKLTMVDLAGSERISKTEATGQRLVEAAAINKSLSALGQVFTALRLGQKHVPYRNSKLTHILEDSLGGDAKTCVFINVSPAESNLPETQSTLQFGAAITKITKEKKEKSAKA